MFKNFFKKIFGNKTTQIPSPSSNNGNGLPAGRVVDLWATFYYSKVLKDTKNPNDIPLLDMQGNKLGPTLRQDDWCRAGIEGTAIIDGVVYNYAGTVGSPQTSCPYKPAETTRWKKSPFKFGIGCRNNPLIPYRTLATDPKFIPFGTKVFIPAAVGVKYQVDGQEYVHDGYFEAGDTGGAIKSNHIDVFIGNVEGGLPGALKQNPFEFIKSSSSKTFKAVIVNP